MIMQIQCKQIVVCLVILCIFSYISKSDAHNWAQTSGEMAQNVVFPSMPSPAIKHWQARFGHATVIAADVNPDPEVNSLGKVFLMGGDSFSEDKTIRDLSPGAFDTSWEHGYKNDVWSTTGTEWYTGGDPRERNEYHQKIPHTTSKMKYELMTSGRHPPPGMTYEDWIICQPYFSNFKYGVRQAALCETEVNIVHWSPRRHHAAVYFNGYIYLMGGRAREFMELPEDRAISGIIGPRVKDVPWVGENKLQRFTTKKEASITKSDVWRSRDGIHWNLVTPGCRAPQNSLVARGNEAEGKWGLESLKCTSDADCWGAESCHPQRKTCVCDMWTSREQHSVVVFNGHMYLSGGYASRLYERQTSCGSYACGDVDSSAYRYYMNDVWRSIDGDSWQLLTEVAWGAYPRGGHQMIVLDPGPRVYTSGGPAAGVDGPASLFIFGGRGGDNTGLKDFDEYYYNDVWSSTNGISWTRQFGGYAPEWTDPIPTGANPARVQKSDDEKWWSPRCAHTVSLEKASPGNLNVRSIFLYGGQTQKWKETGFQDDVWVWRPDVKDEYFRKDFTSEAIFATGDGANFHYADHSPAVYYLSPDSPVEYLRKFSVPTKLNKVNARRYEEKPYLSTKDIETLKKIGINTIRELADAGLYTIIRLRGFDYPQVEPENILNVPNVCDKRALAQAVVSKCTPVIPKMLYDGEKQMPWNVEPMWGKYDYDYLNGGGSRPTDPIQHIKWHGPTRNDWSYLDAQIPEEDPEAILENWNGCDNHPEIQGFFGPDVNGIGYVTQVDSIRNPLPEIQELMCRWTPGKRAYHSALVFEERFYIFGGKSTEAQFMADTWYRDAQFPTVRMVDKPEDNTDYPWFEFAANEPGVSFEYRVWDPYNYIEIRQWTQCVKKHDIGWLDWRKGGPGNGLYSIYVRSVDPAGNRDERFYNNENVYTWYYVSPTPWDIIAQGVAGFIALTGLGYLEYRRRVRKAAMERYAMKRMRRKFKAMQRDIDGRAVDWRTLYMENKAQEEANKGKRKAKRAIRDTKKDARAKEKKKRDKEKEKIKKKLKSEAKSKGITTKAVKEPKSKDEKKEKKEKKQKEESSSKENDKEKKLKDYEKNDGGTGNDPMEAGVKNRKSNKRFKEYEEKNA
jgi:hypothetical protein